MKKRKAKFTPLTRKEEKYFNKHQIEYINEMLAEGSMCRYSEVAYEE